MCKMMQLTLVCTHGKGAEWTDNWKRQVRIPLSLRNEMRTKSPKSL